jgi:hypothetical protein
MEMGVKWGCLDGWRWCYGGAVTRQRCCGGDGSDGWQWDLDFKEFGGREKTEEVGELYGAGEKMEEKKEETVT